MKNMKVKIIRHEEKIKTKKRANARNRKAKARKKKRRKQKDDAWNADGRRRKKGETR